MFGLLEKTVKVEGALPDGLSLPRMSGRTPPLVALPSNSKIGPTVIMLIVASVTVPSDHEKNAAGSKNSLDAQELVGPLAQPEPAVSWYCAVPCTTVPPARV